MPYLFIKSPPPAECLQATAQVFPDLDPSATEAFLHLLHTGDEASRVVEALLTEHRISQGRFMVLMLLLDKLTNCTRTRTPAELADQSRVTRATMTGLIDTLERDGLVTREPDRTDRRMMLVSLTEKGRELLERIMPRHFRLMAELMAPLSEPERRTLVELLAKIARQAAALAPVSPPAPTPAVAV